VNHRVNPPSLPAPSGFSHAIVAAPGHHVYLAGQTAQDATGRIVAVGDVVAQFEQALGNLLTALRGAGGEPEHLVSVTIYIVDVPGYRTGAKQIGEAWRRLCGREYPAAAGIGVPRLWDDDALIEISGVAVLPD
jgi:enamine deaminase RidA (YjgF/YER057c/UK114 family)